VSARPPGAALGIGPGVQSETGVVAASSSEALNSRNGIQSAAVFAYFANDKRVASLNLMCPAH
jgi:hypothetical protein